MIKDERPYQTWEFDEETSEGIKRYAKAHGITGDEVVQLVVNNISMMAYSKDKEELWEKIHNLEEKIDEIREKEAILWKESSQILEKSNKYLQKLIDEEGSYSIDNLFELKKKK